MTDRDRTAPAALETEESKAPDASAVTDEVKVRNLSPDAERPERLGALLELLKEI